MKTGDYDMEVFQNVEISGFPYIPRDPCIQIIPTLGPKVCEYYLHWAIWIPGVLYNRKNAMLIYALH